MIFEVDVVSEISKKTWTLNHTLEDFKNLIYNISSICLNIPEFNGFQILNKEQTSSKIIEALQNFTDYIKSISYRGDIVNSRYFIDFFGLENHFENLDKFEPKPIFHIDNLNYEVSDIVFLENSNILIISCATNFERSAMDSVKFWKKKEKAGEILIYKLNKSNSTSINKNNKENINYINVGPSHSLINSIKKETEISRLYLSPNNKYLIVGYFDGNIEIYQISDDQSAISTQVISLLIKIEVNQNKKRILGIGMNPLTNYIYTACYKDNKIGVSFIDSKNMIQSIIGGESELVGFSYLYKNNFLNDIVITLDINGRLIIGTIKNDNKNIELIFVSLNQLASISLFKVNWDYNHIYIGDKDGEIDVLNVIFQNNDIKVQRVFSASLTKDISNKAKFTKMILGNYPYKIKDVDYNPNKKELFIALHNGTIQIYSHFKNFAECVLYENIRYLNRIIFNKTKSILFTGGVEKDVYGYYIPAYYCTEMSRKLQNANLYNFMNDIKLIKNSIGKINENHKK
jgi:WD40 repeat protein